MFCLVIFSWYMYFVGFLFGLGFDIVIEVGLLGIFVLVVNQGLFFWLMMIFFVLFIVGMVLVDFLDNFVMVGVYGWVFLYLLCKFYYNMIIIVVFVIVVLVIGGFEVLGLIDDVL